MMNTIHRFSRIVTGCIALAIVIVMLIGYNAAHCFPDK